MEASWPTGRIFCRWNRFINGGNSTRAKTASTEAAAKTLWIPKFPSTLSK